MSRGTAAASGASQLAAGALSKLHKLETRVEDLERQVKSLMADKGSTDD